MDRTDKTNKARALAPHEVNGKGLRLPPSSLSVAELVGEIRDEVSLLVKKQIELGRVELRENVRATAMAAGGLGVAAVGAIIGITLLLVAAILALGRAMPAWAAALLVGGLVLLISAVAALLGWRRRVRRPLEKTRTSLKDDLQWMKNRLT